MTAAADELPQGRTYPAETCVTRAALDRWVERQPDAIFAAFPDAESWSYGAFRDRVIAAAAGLQRIGVGRGDHVLVWMPNGPAALTVLVAIHYIGAVAVPINTAYKGALLDHIFASSDARFMVAHSDLVSRLAAARTGRIEVLIVQGRAAEAPAPLRSLPFSALETDAALLSPDRAIEPWDTQSIIYTSGTTGASKGVLSSYMHAYSSVGPQTWTCVRPDDRFLINLPMFHIGGIFITHAMLCAGGSVAVVERFSTERFWDEVRATGATIVFLLGVMADLLMQRPPGPRDRDHPLRRAFLVPFTRGAMGFAERFGVETYTLFNMTELATPTFSEPYRRSRAPAAGRGPACRSGWSTRTTARCRAAWSAR